MKPQLWNRKMPSIALVSLITISWTAFTHAAIQETRYQGFVEAAHHEKPKRTGMHALAPTQAPQIAEIESLTLDPGCTDSDNWCGGTMVAGGQTILLPRNLLIDFPANRLTLKQIFDQAPANCVSAKQSGLARNDTCRLTTKGAYVALTANHEDCGKVIAADVLIVNGPEAVTGPVTFINYTDGFFRIGGSVGLDSGGTMVRMNDPSGTHSIQQGKGCLTVSQNCSPDIRFTNDPVNYTTASINGYPICLPSQLVKEGHVQTADKSGLGDPLCPDTNRTTAVPPTFFVQDSRRFAPLKLGDSVLAMGGFVNVGGVTFLSAHTLTDNMALTTRETADQPDYIHIESAGWQLPPFTEGNVVGNFTGLSTLPDSQLDVFALRVDPRDNLSHLDPLTSTVGNPRTVNKLVGGPGGKWQIQLRIKLPAGAPVPPSTSPCTHLTNAGFNVCPNGGTLAEEFSILSPPSREIQAVTRRRVPLARNVFTLDILGRKVSNGQYLMPLGVNLGGLIMPDPGEGNLAGAGGPEVVEALPWTLDRRTSPNGCANDECESNAQPLLPYPVSNVDLPKLSIANGVPAQVANRPITFFVFDGQKLTPRLLPFPPINSCAFVPETLLITTAEFRIFTNTWTVRGTTTGIAPENQITIFSGPKVNGTLIGVSPVGSNGQWNFIQNNSPILPSSSVSVETIFGTKIENIPVVIKN